jgi:ERCC4-related helicase
MSSASQSLVPGARIEIRDAEWIVKKIERSSRSGNIIYVTGISGIVQDKDAIFIDSLEGDIEIIDPAKIELVADGSSYFNDTLLYLEGQLQRSLPVTKDPILANKAAIDSLPFQVEPTKMALAATRVRILMADDVGLGKTLEAGILTSELIRRGRAKRILVIVTKSMLTQFQKEFWTRFSIPLTRLDSVGIQRVRNRIPNNHNPFHYFDKAIISVDTLKNDLQYRTAIENSWWDLIIIDEAHNVADRSKSSGSRAQRSKLAERLASRSDALVLLSATPHDGSMRSFASLMQMLDPTSIADSENYGPEDIKGLFVRRFRTTPEVKRDLGSKIPERKSECIKADASIYEETAYDILHNLKLASDEGVKKASQLFKTTLLKALSSSPEACAESLEKRLKKIEGKDDAVNNADRTSLVSLLEAVRNIDKGNFTKYNRLLELLKENKWSGKKATDRLVIFTERIATLRWLSDNLKQDIGLSDKAVAELHGSGGMSDKEVQKIVDDFGQEKSPIRLLIATDMASEGINLHYQSHKVVHFDIPWSLMTFQQRNGRIDRYGQTHQPLIWYMMTHISDPKIGGDTRILEILVEKEERAWKNIGDPSTLMGTNDKDEQEEIVAEAINSGKTAVEFGDGLDETSKNETTSPLGKLDALLKAARKSGQDDDVKPTTAVTKEVPRIYPTVFEFTDAALSRMKENSYGIDYEVDQDAHVIDLAVPEDFKERGDFGVGGKRAVDTRWMPREAVPESGRIILTDDPSLIGEQIQKSRANDDSSWPNTQYLWEIHPIVDWLGDKAASLFSRKQAPVMRVEGVIPADEVVFLMNGVVPNRRGHAVIDEWIGVHFGPDGFIGYLELASLLEKLDLRNKQPNPGEFETDSLKHWIGDAVDRARNHVRDVRNEVQEKIDDELVEQLQRLDKLKVKHKVQLELKFDLDKGNSIQKTKLERAIKRSDNLFKDYWRWIEETRQTADDPNPYVRLVAVFRG